MNRRVTIIIAICVIMIISLLFYWLCQKGKPSHLLEHPDSGVSSSPHFIAQNKHPGSALPAQFVDPTYELADMIEEFESQLMKDTDRLFTILEAENRWQSARSQGKTLWNSDEWMKPPEYYKNLDIQSLTLECFERPIFAMEMGIYDDPILGLIRLKYMHNGFSELFRRSDMWQGILQLYEHLGNELQSDASLVNIRLASLTLDALQSLYRLPEFRVQVSGREKQFLKAHIYVLQKYRDYIDTFNPETVGSPTPFFEEPVIVAEMALVFAKQVDPKQYPLIEQPIRKIKFPETQNIQDIRLLVDAVLLALDGISNE